MSTWTPQPIEIRTTKYGRKCLRTAYVSDDGLFAYYETYGIGHLELGYTVCHVPSGYALSRGHSNKRNAEIFAAIWRALPMSWDKDLRAMNRALQKMPAQLRAWINAVKPQVEENEVSHVN